MRVFKNLWAIITGRVITREEVDRVLQEIATARAEVADSRQSINALAARLAKRLPNIDRAEPAQSGPQTEMPLAPEDHVSRLRTARFLSMTGRGAPPTPPPAPEVNHVADSGAEK